MNDEYPFPYINKLADNLDRTVGPEIRRKILAGAETLTTKTHKPERAAVMKTIMERMAACLDPETAVRVRLGCACKPRPYLKDAKALLAQSADIPEFLTKVQGHSYLGNPLRYEDGKISGDFGFRRCVCSNVGAAKEPLPMLWCECCRGHLIWFYESLFHRPVRVEFRETAITGGEECRYVVYFEPA